MGSRVSRAQPQGKQQIHPGDPFFCIFKICKEATAAGPRGHPSLTRKAPLLAPAMLLCVQHNHHRTAG